MPPVKVRETPEDRCVALLSHSVLPEKTEKATCNTPDQGASGQNKADTDRAFGKRAMRRSELQICFL
jgi:hypothetical protein